MLKSAIVTLSVLALLIVAADSPAHPIYPTDIKGIRWVDAEAPGKRKKKAARALHVAAVVLKVGGEEPMVKKIQPLEGEVVIYSPTPSVVCGVMYSNAAYYMLCTDVDGTDVFSAKSSCAENDPIGVKLPDGDKTVLAGLVCVVDEST